MPTRDAFTKQTEHNCAFVFRDTRLHHSYHAAHCKLRSYIRPKLQLYVYVLLSTSYIRIYRSFTRLDATYSSPSSPLRSPLRTYNFFLAGALGIFCSTALSIFLYWTLAVSAAFRAW